MKRLAALAAGACLSACAIVRLPLPPLPPGVPYCDRYDACEDACRTGDSKACGFIAMAERMGWGTPKNLERFIAYARLGCDGNDGQSCNLLFVAYRSGMGVEKNAAKAIQYDEKSCAVGFAKACNSLGIIYDGGETVPADPARAMTLFAQSCDGGAAIGCLSLAKKAPDGMVSEDRAARALPLLEAECDMEPTAVPAVCTLVGRMLANGRGSAPDNGRAKRYYRRGCTLGDADACAQNKP